MIDYSRYIQHTNTYLGRSVDPNISTDIQKPAMRKRWSSEPPDETRTDRNWIATGLINIKQRLFGDILLDNDEDVAN